MKVSLGTTLLATLAVSVMASSAMAANPNGPKPKCPLGQIAVVENGQYICKEATIKAPGTSSERGSTSPKRKLAVKKPMRGKADFVILSASRIGGTSNKFEVVVKNQGYSPTSGGFVQGLNMGPGGGGAIGYMPKFQPGAVKAIVMEFKMSKFVRGARVLFHADAGTDIPESNENNNQYSINY